MHFISTLLATLIGVLLAVTLANNASAKKEKEDTVKLLNSANRIIDMTLAYTQGLGDYMATIEDDSLLLDAQKKNLLPFPDLLETIISKELMLIKEHLRNWSYY